MLSWNLHSCGEGGQQTGAREMIRHKVMWQKSGWKEGENGVQGDGGKRASRRRYHLARNLEDMNNTPCPDQGLEHSRKSEQQHSSECDVSKLKRLF